MEIREGRQVRAMPLDIALRERGAVDTPHAICC